jgi:hypothetical protein
MKTIEKIEHDGFVDLRDLHSLTYEDTRKQFKSKYNIVLPTKKTLKSAKTAFGNLWLMLGPLTITVTFEDSEWWQFQLMRGFITDLASVPNAFKAIIDNDGPEVVVPALVHDANFACHYLSFEDSNELFRQMIRGYGGSKAKAKAAHLAVSLNAIRQTRYFREDAIDRWSKKTTRFMKSR